MDRQEILGKIAKKLLAKENAVKESITCGEVGIEFLSDGAFRYLVSGSPIHFAYSKATVMDGRMIDTRTAKQKEIKVVDTNGGKNVSAVYEENGLRLTQEFALAEKATYFVVSCTVKDLKHKQTESNYLAPLDFGYPDPHCDPLFRSLDQKMLLVPYDNDMWVRYESAPLRPGRTSYDVTAIYDEITKKGLVIGALDFTDWKNAIKCSGYDARCYTAFSGVADECTHDCMPHGSLIGEQVTSSRFLCGWYEDIREGMEEFGKVCMEGKDVFTWDGPVPFGWNSYAGLSIEMPLVQHWRETARFIGEELPNFKDSNGQTTINLDGNFLLDKKQVKQVLDEIHSRGQRAGNYMSPLICHKLLGIMPLRGTPGKTMKSIVMKDKNGEPYPAADGSVPVDITLPAAEKNLRLWIREIVEADFDYIKIDFLSHGAVEGKRHDKTVRTGRQALNRFYDILREELDEKKIGRKIFVDLSIAPLFPAGGGHARRCCCDSFGHHEDVRYVLNALNFGWWTSGSLYRFADPDHTVLHHAYPDGRGNTDLNSARSRYLASVISGTVMLLSDNYGPTGDPEDIQNAKERARLLANNEEINAVARLGRPFLPLELKSYTTNFYYLRNETDVYLAIFNFEDKGNQYALPLGEIGAKDTGTAHCLWSKQEISYEKGLSVNLEPYDCELLRFAAI
ncbi:MAG: hypothetical protein IJ091_04525 [Oscillospiraceae bacterium]|nr:hypothetical protein [Oscillospiraceae bacterium]